MKIGLFESKGMIRSERSGGFSSDISVNASNTSEHVLGQKAMANFAGSYDHSDVQVNMEIMSLKKTDAKVRRHEMAHKAAGGIYTSAPSYDYTLGPDGRYYITSGSVVIDTKEVVSDPEATVRKMEIVKRAALAPIDPSSEDIGIAMKAMRTRSQAQNQIIKEKKSEVEGEREEEENSHKRDEAIAVYMRTFRNYEGHYNIPQESYVA